MAERPLPDLAREITAGAVRLAAATAAWLRLIAEFDRREGWSAHGIVSCAHWLAWQCGMAPVTAREHVRVARALTGLPRLAAAFAEGRLSYSKVRAVTRVAEPETEQTLLDLALAGTASQVERAVRAWRRSDRVDEGTVARKKEFQYWWDDDGTLVVRMRLAPEDGADFLAAVESRTETVARRDRAAEKRAAADHAPDAAGDDAAGSEREALAAARERTTARRCAAVVDLVRAGRRVDRRPGDPPLREVVVHADAAVLAEDGAAGQAYLEGGPALHPAQVRRMLCGAAVVTMLERGREVLGVGRSRRLPTRAQRRALIRRDGGCARPGCTETRIERLHAHHMRHWLFGGGTDVDNLVLLCDVDHGLVHDQDLVMSRRDGRLVVLTPDGRRVWGAADAAFVHGVSADATGSGDAFIGVQPIDELAARRPVAAAAVAPRVAPAAPSGTRPVGDLEALLFPSGPPELPVAMQANGERMDLDHVVWVLLASRDFQRRLAAEARGRPLVAA
ncbi:HNH endonuclease signature motif containing protein [Blastococcus sp. TF02-9]|uniref:HNH endonuclease signature motif containing protein n=1 Tax=Blastococcus sp. TF02-09 TaxID=2250576 RepID=UPI001F436B26|nr:HNH endonuclease signature motif containing protein [Blastococcus sp. TF02-9]